jgi:prophage DNA circulation protein
MSEEMKSPTTYADWVSSFQIFRDGLQDEELLVAVSKGKVPWTKGVAERFTQKMSEAVSARLQRAVDQFAKDLGRASGEENAVVQAILTLRRQISYLIRFVTSSTFPEEIVKKFSEEIEKNAQYIQNYLFEEVKKSSNSRLLRVVQHTPILVEQTKSNEAPIPMGKTKRRIIF